MGYSSWTKTRPGFLTSTVCRTIKPFYQCFTQRKTNSKIENFRQGCRSVLISKMLVKSNRQSCWDVCLKLADRLCMGAQRWRARLFICILSWACVWMRGSSHDMRHAIWHSFRGCLFDISSEDTLESVHLLTFSCCRDREASSIMQNSVESS